MKFKLLSDLHIEGYKFHYTWDGEDVLFLAGDIHTRNRHYELLEQTPPFVKVIMVAGNHEYYGKDFNEVRGFLNTLGTVYPNFHFLDNDCITIDGVEIFGGTMFTDFELDGIGEKWFAEQDAMRFIADFAHIPEWSIEKHLQNHRDFVFQFQYWLKATEGKKRIVMTHFMPHPVCTNVRFMGSRLNPYFTTNMDKYMGWEGYWLCGHGHDSLDKMIGDTRLIMNPRGYGRENEYGFKPNLLLEI